MIFPRDIYDFDKNTYLNFLAKMHDSFPRIWWNIKKEREKNSWGRALLVLFKRIKKLKYSKFKLVSNTAGMDIDKIFTVFIMIMFQRILNKLDEVEAFFVV